MEVLCSPNTDDIEKHLDTKPLLKKRLLHLVPTLILYRRRLKFYFRKLNHIINANNQKIDVEKKIHEYVDLFEIDKYIKYISRNRIKNILTNSEASIILERIIKQLPSTNNISWLSVTDDIFSLFSELSLSGLTISELLQISDNQKWKLVIDIYKIYLEELDAKDLYDTGTAALKCLLELDISNYDELILDGSFLPFMYKHQVIINKFIDQNKPITILIPYDLETPQQPANKAIEHVYSQLLPTSKWISIKNKGSNSLFISRLPKMIFVDDTRTHLDTSFELLRFPTVEEELTFILQKIYILVRYKEISPKQIVIVTPGAMELRPLIREISEQYNLKVNLPKRPLMHLLQGRAIQYLYNIQTDSRKTKETYLDTQMFKIFISGTILNHSTELLSIFNKIETFFDDCVSIVDWENQLTKLTHTLDLLDTAKYAHHPIRDLTLENLRHLKVALEQVKSLSSDLFDASAQSVSLHVQRLVRLLNSDHRIRPMESEFLDRLSKITSSISSQQELNISTYEFGVRVAAFFSEQEEFDDAERNSEDEDDIFLDKEILVTGPNNVEFQKYEYVFMCRFTQDIYPESKRYNWILNESMEFSLINLSTNIKFSSIKELERFYLDRSLYYFYITLCSPTVQLTISYSQLDNGKELSHSHYLHDIAKVFGIEEGNRLENKNELSLEALLEKSKVLKNPSSIKPITNDSIQSNQYRRTITHNEFTAEEVAIYKYCPRRFYYQQKYTIDNVYSQLFHLQSYVSSCLYEKAVELFVNNEPFPIRESLDLKKMQNSLYDKVISYRIAAEELIRPIFPISNREWHNVLSQTDFFLRSLITSIFENSYVKEYRRSGNSSILIDLWLSDDSFEIKVDEFIFTSAKELYIQYNKTELHRYSISNMKDFLSFSSKDYDEKDYMDEVKQWYFTFKRDFNNKTPLVMNALNSITESISEGNFKKSVGGHCMYCTYNDICREREVDE